MSDLSNNYANPLDDFKSYSYHFIITAASTTEALRLQTGSGQQSPLIGLVNDVDLGGKFSVGSGFDSYLVLDTRRFAQYSVIDLEFEHLPGTGPTHNPAIQAGLGSMKIIDSTGLAFFNYLLDLTQNKLKSTQTSSFFLLSIIYVGHNTDGSTETISTCFTPFTILRIAMDFSSSGSIYDIMFCPIDIVSDKSSASYQSDSKGTVNKITTEGKSKTIGGLLNSLEEQLNKKSVEFYVGYNKSNKEVQKKPGKLVQYMITIPDEWKDFIPDLAPRSWNLEFNFPIKSYMGHPAEPPSGKTETKKMTADTHLSFSDSMGISDCIKKILEQSTQFLKLHSDKNIKDGNAMSFRCVQSQTSDDSTFVVHFDIFPYRIHTPEKIKQDKINLIEYDYIFTGYNSHIKDLKIEYQPELAAAALWGGLGVTKSNYAETNGQKAAKDKPSQPAEAVDTDNSAIRDSDPIFPGLRTKTQREAAVNHNTENKSKTESEDAVKTKQNYTSTLSKLHFYQNFRLNMVIRGNPNIIRKLADSNSKGGIPVHTQIVSSSDITKLLKNGQLEDAVKSGFSSSKAAYVADYTSKKIASAVNGGDALLGGPDISTQPIFAKINIRAPNLDYIGNQNDGPMFTDELFYNGLYRIMKIKTSFSNGEMTQTLEMCVDTTEKFNPKQ